MGARLVGEGAKRTLQLSRPSDGTNVWDEIMSLNFEGIQHLVLEWKDSFSSYSDDSQGADLGYAIERVSRDHSIKVEWFPDLKKPPCEPWEPWELSHERWIQRTVPQTQSSNVNL